MLGIFKKATLQDLLAELKKDNFDEVKANAMLSSIDINQKTQDGKSLLHQLSNQNKVEGISWLVKKGVNINSVDNNGFTPLMIASSSGSVEALKKLISLGANTAVLNNHGRNALGEAVFADKEECFFLLKDITKELDLLDLKGQNIFFYAAQNGNIRIIIELLKIESININQKDIDGKTLLFVEQVYSNKEILTTLISKGLDLKALDNNGKNVLFYFIKSKSLSIDYFEYLLELGFDLEQKDTKGNTLIFKIVSHLNKLFMDSKDAHRIKILYELIDILLDKKVNTSMWNVKGDNLLTMAARAKNVQLMKFLLKNDVDANHMTEDRKTTVSIIAMMGKDYLQELIMLLDFGADVNIEDARNQTIIEKLINADLYLKNKIHLSRDERKEIVEEGDYQSVLKEILYNSEVNLRKLNSKNDPYFFEALMLDNVELVRLLIKYGADINQLSHDGLNVIYKFLATHKDPMKESEKKAYFNTLKNIISLGVDINARDNYGGVVLHKAILDNDEQTIKILINAKADLNAIDNRGRNHIHNTIWKNRIKIFKLIYSYNKKLLNQPDKFGVLPINYAAFLGYHEFVEVLIDHESQINNPYKKGNYILQFLEKFHPNLNKLLEQNTNKHDKDKIEQLINNMKKEFDVKE
ncbi:MAG: ankyrin repeat domain-containing protein [Arcobacteraceae bacterium]